MIQKIFNLIKSSTTQQLILFSLFLSLISLGLLIVFSKVYYAREGFRFLLLGITFFLWGCSGLVIVIRKESPPPWPATGLAAVIQGLILILSTWSITVLSIIKIVSH